MAEGLLEGALGGEEAKPEVEAPQPLAGVEAFAAAIAAKLAGSDPGVARKTEEFLTDQSQLLRVQKRHLEEEHEARLHFLRGQAREVDIRRFSLRLRVGFQLFLVLVATFIGIGAVLMVHDAASSRRVVIEPFEVSPNIASDVPTGRIVAAQFLDCIAHLQAAGHLRTDLKRDLTGAWASEVSLEIPETGISLGQVEQFLRQRLGHDVYITGDVVRTSAGVIAVTARGSDLTAKTVSGPETDLGGLLRQSAEYLFGEANLEAFTQYLQYTGQHQRAIDFIASHITNTSGPTRSNLLEDWAGSILTLRRMDALPEATRRLEQAIHVDPNNLFAYSDLSDMLSHRGDQEAAARVLEQEMTVAGGKIDERVPGAFINYFNYYNDLLSLRNAYQMDINVTGGSFYEVNEPLYLAIVDMQLHDPTSGNEVLNTVLRDAADPADNAIYAIANALSAADQGDYAAASTWWDRRLQIDDTNVWMQIRGATLACAAAVDYERAGFHDKADAALDAPKRILGVAKYVDCYRSRADVLDLRGDWAGAKAWYTKAIDLGASSPAGYYAYGLALMKHGDLARAAEQFKLSNEKGPGWADPLKGWGDVLMKQGETKEALAKYDEALKYAPNWKQLKEARAALAKQKS